MSGTTSYTSNRGGGIQGLAREAIHLLRSYSTTDADARVALLVARLREREQLMEDRTGIVLRNKRILDVGAGQRLSQLVYFSRYNDVVGIDLDVVAQGLDPRPYLRMLRSNGPKRVVKTLTRKALRLDAAERAGLVRQLRLGRYPRLEVLQMDASAMTFPDATFDVVYSFSVFSHLSRPDRVIDEMVRVLRPGGVGFNSFLLYTSRTGSMDIRGLGGRETGLPLWAHLRPQHGDQVIESAYLNKVRLPEWRRLFSDRMSGCEFVLGQYERDRLEPEARRLHARGELLDYELDELLTAELAAVWKKPEAQERPHVQTPP